MKNEKETITHGDAFVMAIASLPKNAKRIEPSNDEYHIIADSETTGNHHVVGVKESTEFFMDENGTMFMQTQEPTEISCVIAERHSPIEIPAGTYEFGIQNEYDHFEQNYQKIRD